MIIGEEVQRGPRAGNNGKRRRVEREEERKEGGGESLSVRSEKGLWRQKITQKIRVIAAKDHGDSAKAAKDHVHKTSRPVAGAAASRLGWASPPALPRLGIALRAPAALRLHGCERRARMAADSAACGERTKCPLQTSLQNEPLRRKGAAAPGHRPACPRGPEAERGVQ